MATVYSSNYKQNPIRSTLYEAIYPPTEHAGIVYSSRFVLVIPVGTTNADVLKLLDFGVAVPVTSPQYAGVYTQRLVYTTSANAGGSLVASLGFATAGQTAFGSGLTTLQSAATTEITAAVVNAAAPVITPDTLQFLITAGGPSTLSCTVTGFISYVLNSPNVL
jgi:hypothetical protein